MPTIKIVRKVRGIVPCGRKNWDGRVRLEVRYTE